MQRLGRAAAIGAAWVLVALRAGSAQLTVTLDVGAARVEYDGFLPSGAASVSPALRITTPSMAFAARGTWLGFESGNTSVQGLVAGSVFTQALGRWRGELAGTAGVSSYAGFAGFAHALARGRVHFLGRRGGAWLGGTLGRSSYYDRSRPVLAAAVGVWHGLRPLNFTLGASVTQVGDTAYTDVEWSGYWRGGPVEIDAILGARGGHGGGQGVYGEAVTTVSLYRSLAATLAFGRYPTDPIRGSVSGRYASIGLRFTGFAANQPQRATPARPQPPVVALAGSNGHLVTATAAIEVEAAGAMLVVRAPGAELVEVIGDFTDWEPVKLKLVGDVWRYEIPLDSGVRRLNVRVDGGAWSVPQGATVEHDDFGSAVGTMVVP